MLEIGSRWIQKEAYMRDVRTIVQIVKAQDDEQGEVVYYRLDGQWPLYTEEELRAERILVTSSRGESL